MAILIYADQSFTAADGTVCVKDNSYTVSEFAANVATQRGQAHISEIKKDPYSAEGQNGIPYTFTTRTLRRADNERTFLPTDTSQTATIPTNLPEGFSCAFNSNVTIAAASGVTVTDKRTTGATNPTCAVINTGTNTYEVWGSKT
jgi:hypothetical protein